jgi:hypothetical protein
MCDCAKRYSFGVTDLRMIPAASQMENFPFLFRLLHVGGKFFVFSPHKRIRKKNLNALEARKKNKVFLSVGLISASRLKICLWQSISWTALLSSNVNMLRSFFFRNRSRSRTRKQIERGFIKRTFHRTHSHTLAPQTHFSLPIFFFFSLRTVTSCK